MPPVRRATPTATEATSDGARPRFHFVYKPADVPAAATALPSPWPENSAVAAAQAMRPAVISEQALHPMCFAYALVTRPSPNTGGDDIIQAVLAAVPRDLWSIFTLLPSAHATMVLRFPTPALLEAAMSQQPFAAHDGTAVTLVRAWHTSILDDYLVHNMPQHLVRSAGDLLVHAVLHNYPAEQRTQREIGANCQGFGWVLEVDAACYDAPDLTPLHVVLCVRHPSVIPRELRIVYGADGSTSVVPVQVHGVFDWSTAFRAHGRYVRFFKLD